MKPFTNPVTSTLKLTYTIPEESPVEIQLRDILGQPVYRQTLKAKKGWNHHDIPLLNNFIKGMYILSLSNNNIVINKRLIKI